MRKGFDYASMILFYDLSIDIFRVSGAQDGFDKRHQAHFSVHLYSRRTGNAMHFFMSLKNSFECSARLAMKILLKRTDFFANGWELFTTWCDMYERNVDSISNHMRFKKWKHAHDEVIRVFGEDPRGFEKKLTHICRSSTTPF